MNTELRPPPIASPMAGAHEIPRATRRVDRGWTALEMPMMLVSIVLVMTALQAGHSKAAPAAAPQVAPIADLFQRRVLASGHTLAVLTVADAPRQTFFAFLPIGLGNDEAGHAQWSHLLEHMLIRSTDAEGLADGAIVFNGETSDLGLRLDVHAPPAEAERAAAKLAGWISAEKFDAAVLEREKKNIASELESTSASGYTHKWASAAWTQAVRYGASEIHLRGDVEAATVEGVADYARRRIRLDTHAALFAIGPRSADEVQALFAKLLPGGGGAPIVSKADAAPPHELVTGKHEATWDLPRHHVIDWYVLPNERPADRAAAVLLATALSMALQKDAGLGPARVIALASSDVVVPHGRALQLSASLPDAASASIAQAAFQRALDGLDTSAPGGSLDVFVTMARQEMAGGLPDFAPLRKQWAGRPGVELLEAQLVLPAATREQSTGLAWPDFAAAVQAVTADQLRELRDRALAPKMRSSLRLLPAGG